MKYILLKAASDEVLSREETLRISSIFAKNLPDGAQSKLDECKTLLAKERKRNMKRTLSLLIAAMLVVCCIVSPASSFAEQRLARNLPAMRGSSVSELGISGKPLRDADVSLLQTNGAAVKDADLNEALNVPGGTLEFVTMDYPDYGLFPWVVDGDHAKAGNSGIDGNQTSSGMTQSQVMLSGYFNDGQAVSFRFRVSCQSAENTDYLAVFVDNAPVAAWCGEVDWQSFSFPVSAGEHQIAWAYTKDADTSEGEDCAWLDDVEITEAATYSLVHSPELDAVLNAAGGALEFFTPEEPAAGCYPWAAEADYAVSTNEGVSSGAVPSISTVQTTVNAAQGDVLSFRWRVSSEEKMDLFRFYIDGVRVLNRSGEVGWNYYIAELEPGEHELRWDYDKDSNGNIGEDRACLNEVRIGAPLPVTGVEIMEALSVPGCRKAKLEWNVLPGNAFNRGVSFSSSDENIAAVDENGVVYGINQGSASITVTTAEGGFTDTCTVTVTEPIYPVEIYGFMYAQMQDDTEGYYRDMYEWCSFIDTEPQDVTMYGQMPEYEYDLVLCAAQAGNTVYGYDVAGRYFKMDFEALQLGILDVEYFDCNVTGDESFYPNEMAYDYSTGKMYIINEMTALWEIDMETGDVDLESGKAITGEYPNPGVDDYKYALGFAIDLEGTAYIMLAGMGLGVGGNGCARLATLDLESAEFTVVGQTTAKAYQEQSMCFDYSTGRLYWAQFNTIYGLEPMDLYVVDTETAELELLGKVSTYGAEILGMFIPYNGGTPGSEYDAGDVDMNGTVEVRDALLAARFALGLQTLSDEQIKLADVDNDGSVGIDDAVLICRIALGVA